MQFPRTRPSHNELLTSAIQAGASASINWQAEYEPYGRVFALRAGDVHQPLRLPGQVAEQFDTGANGSTARSFNVFRWYQPVWAKYSAPDPLGLLEGAGEYGYSNDNPSLAVDPLGLCVNFTRNGNNVKLDIPIKFIGPGSSKDVRQLIVNEIQKDWSGNFGPLHVNAVVNQVSPSADFGANFNTFTINLTSAGTTLGNKVWVGANDSPWGAAHETGHLMGLDDEYNPANKKEALPSWAGNIMASYFGKADLRNILLIEISSKPCCAR